jgi:hypothetical protein
MPEQPADGTTFVLTTAIVQAITTYAEETYNDVASAWSRRLGELGKVIEESAPPRVTLDNPHILTNEGLQAMIFQNPKKASLNKAFSDLQAELAGVQVTLTTQSSGHIHHLC